MFSLHRRNVLLLHTWFASNAHDDLLLLAQNSHLFCFAQEDHVFVFPHEAHCRSAQGDAHVLAQSQAAYFAQDGHLLAQGNHFLVEQDAYRVLVKRSKVLL